MVMSVPTSEETDTPGWFRDMVPGAIAAVGQDLWVADVTQPALSALLGLRTPILARWSARRGAHRPAAVTMSPHRAGCYVAGRDGVVHCDHDGRIRRLTDVAVDRGALCDDTYAVVQTQVPGMEPATAHLFTPDQSPIEIRLPGPLSGLVTTERGFLILLRTGSERNGYAHVDHCLVRLSPDGELTVGPPLDNEGRTHRFALATDRWVYDNAPRGTPRAPRFRRITPDLSLDDGHPAPTILTSRQSAGLWPCGHRLFANTWTPNPPSTPDTDSPQPPRSTATVCTLIELDADTLTLLASTDLSWIPDQVARTDDGTVWISGLDTTNPARPARPFHRWVSPTGSSPYSVEITNLFETSVHLPIKPSADITDLDAWMRQRKDTITHAIGHGGGSFEPLDSRIDGEFPAAHVVITFRPYDELDLIGAIAVPLFTLDGDPREPPGQFSDIAIMEQLRTGGLDRLKNQTPDAEGLVWLQPPRTPLGHPRRH